MNKLILTFDLEYWFESLSIQKYLKEWDKKESLEKFITRILSLLKNYQNQATFFVTGEVLKREPLLIKKISDEGQEIAIHSIDHRPLWQKKEEEFATEIGIITKKIEELTNQKPISHRAPNFSLDNSTRWALKVLEKKGIKCDSSIFPIKLRSVPFFKTYAYGSKTEKFKPYKIDLEDITKEDSNSPIIEFPISVWHYKKIKIPVTGGIYIRLIPWLIFKKILRNKLRKEVACIHFHPFDFNERTPSIKMPKLKKFIKYYNTRNTWKKLEYLIKKYRSASIKQYLDENTIN